MNKINLFTKAVITAALVFVISVSASAHAPINQAANSSLPTVLEKVTPSIVNITVQKEIPTTPFSQPQATPDNKPATQLIGIGSGVIIDADKGLIVTNWSGRRSYCPKFNLCGLIPSSLCNGGYTNTL